MRPGLFGSILPFHEARRLTLEAVDSIRRTEIVTLSRADTRVAAETVSAPFDVPAFDRAAMDGYAVRADDTRGASAARPAILRRVGVVHTGGLPDRTIAAGECLEIATGAPMPEGATAVVMVEHTTADDASIAVHSAVESGQNIGRRGADLRSGSDVVRVGDELTPARVGVLAAIGRATVSVYERPTVAILSTGDEVVPPGAALTAGHVYDINRFTIEAVVARHGGRPVAIAHADDALASLDAALDAVAPHDMAVFSGGSSVGGRDLMSDALGRRGTIIFHGIAVKPGKPTLLGTLGRTLVFGMPGYPTSCLLSAYVLLVPALRAAARLPAWQPRQTVVPLSRRIVSTRDRHQFYTVRLAGGRAEPAFKASGDITSMAEADGYIEVPEGIESVEAGETVTVTLF